MTSREHDASEHCMFVFSAGFFLLLNDENVMQEIVSLLLSHPVSIDIDYTVFDHEII